MHLPKVFSGLVAVLVLVTTAVLARTTSRLGLIVPPSSLRHEAHLAHDRSFALHGSLAHRDSSLPFLAAGTFQQPISPADRLEIRDTGKVTVVGSGEHQLQARGPPPRSQSVISHSGKNGRDDGRSRGKAPRGHAHYGYAQPGHTHQHSGHAPQYHPLGPSNPGASRRPMQPSGRRPPVPPARHHHSLPSDRRPPRSEKQPCRNPSMPSRKGKERVHAFYSTVGSSSGAAAPSEKYPEDEIEHPSEKYPSNYSKYPSNYSSKNPNRLTLAEKVGLGIALPILLPWWILRSCEDP